MLDAQTSVAEDVTLNRSRLEELVAMDLHRRWSSFMNDPSHAASNQTISGAKPTAKARVRSDASTTSSVDEMSDWSDEHDCCTVAHEVVRADVYVKPGAHVQTTPITPPPGLDFPPGLAPPPGLDSLPAKMVPHEHVMMQAPGLWHAAPQRRSFIAGAVEADAPLVSIRAGPARPPGVWNTPAVDVDATDKAHQHSGAQRQVDKLPLPQEFASANSSLSPGETSCKYEASLGSWRVDWSVDLKKMRSTSGSMISRGFEIDLGTGIGALTFKVLLSCAASHEKRGGMMFRKARACNVALQCKSELVDEACITYDTWITGKRRQGPFTHNFLENASSSTQWNFSDTMAQAFASELIISFELRLKAFEGSPYF